MSPDEHTFTLTKDMLLNIKAVAKNSLKLARNVSQHPEGLGAVRRTHSNPRYPDLKVTFAGNNVAPSAPYKEDLVDANDGPPKYESLQKKSEPPQGVMQVPGSTSHDIPPQPLPVYAWQQQGGAFQYPGPTMNPMHMGNDWINKQISNTEKMLKNRGFPESTWKLNVNCQ